MITVIPDINPVPIPYGSLDFYQLHFIVKCGDTDVDKFLAKCDTVTTGWLNNKRIIGIKWTGASSFIDLLQNDIQLTGMLMEILPFEGQIRIDPVNDQVRIYGKWHNDYETRFSHRFTDVVDRIAMHIKTSLADGKIPE